MKWLITWLLLAASAFAINTCNATGSGSGSNCTLNGVAAHHLLVVASTCAAAGPCQVADSFGLTWQPTNTVPYSVIGSSQIPQYNVTLYWANTGASSGNDVITQTSAVGGGINSLVAAEEPVDYVFDVNAYQGIAFCRTSNGGSGGIPNCTYVASGDLVSMSVSPAIDNELLVSVGDCLGGVGSFGLAGGSPFVQQARAGGNCLRLADRTLGASTASTSQTVTWNHDPTSFGSNTFEAVVLAAFRPSPAAATNPAHKCINGRSTIAAPSQSTVACTLTVGPNHVLVAATTGNAIATISDSFGLTWTKAIAQATVVEVWYASTAGNSGSDTVTIDFGGNTASAGILALEYLNPATLDTSTYTGEVHGGNRNTATASITTHSANELVVAIAAPSYDCVCAGAGPEGFAGSSYLTPVTVGWTNELWEPWYTASIHAFDNVNVGVAGAKTFTLNQNEDVSYASGNPNNGGFAYYSYAVALLAFGPPGGAGVLKEVWIF